MQVRDLVKRKRPLYPNPLHNFGIVREKLISGKTPAPCVILENPLDLPHKNVCPYPITGEVYLELVFSIGQAVVWKGQVGTIFNFSIEEQGIFAQVFGAWRTLEKINIEELTPLQDPVFRITKHIRKADSITL